MDSTKKQLAPDSVSLKMELIGRILENDDKRLLRTHSAKFVTSYRTEQAIADKFRT